MLSTSSLDPTVQAAESARVRLERILQVASHDYELRLQFGQGDRVGTGHLVMGIQPQQVAEADPHALKGQALHLLGHYLSDSLPWAEAARREEAQGKPHFMALWHALEDARVENWLVMRWPGSRRAFDARIPPNLGGFLFKMMPSTFQVETGIYYEGRGYRGAQYSREVGQALERVSEAIQHGATGPTPQSSLEATGVIYPAVALLLREEHRLAAPGATELKPRPLEPGEAEAKPEPEHEADATHEQPPPSEEGPPDIALFEDELVSVGVLGRRQEFPEWFRPGSAPWFERGIGEKAVHPTAGRTDRQTIVEPPRGDYHAYRALWSEVQREIGFLAHRLTNLLLEEVYLRYGGYYRSGKLNMAKLWKQRIGDYRLFQRQVSGGHRGVAFTLLVDESASMRGQDKYKSATKVALLLGETLSQLGVPLEIIGFTTAEYEARAAMRLGLTPAHEYRTTRCSALEHRLYKRFDEPYHIVRTRLTGIEPRRNNWDEEHLLFAFRRVQTRSEPRKVIIVISDGQPNGDADHLIATVESLEQMGCKVIGVGIGADFVRQVYRHPIVVSDFRQMAEELLQVLAGELRGGRAFPGSPADRTDDNRASL